MDFEGRLASSLADRYVIETEIGRGGMATVYSARDLKHDRKVALKVLSPDISESVAGDRFLREVKISARLNHPNIVPLFDSGRADGVLYYVMPLQEGETLRARLDREGPLPLCDAVRIAADVAGALAHAHAHGVVHRDIKPENIILSHGQAVLADFGVARALEFSSTEPLTTSGLAVGTPWYMSPEQAQGKGDVDGRSDLYSLGCVLYECVGGEPPFPGRTPRATIARRLSEKPLPLSLLRESAPVRLDALIQKALRRVPADRYRTAQELQEALTAPDLLSDEEGIRKLSLRRKILLGSLATLFVAAAWVAIRAWLPPSGPALDPDKVVVFPLGDRAGGGMNGANASLAIIMALEHADPLRPMDAWNRLSPEQRDDINLLAPEEAREIALTAGAGHYITGALTRRGDSVGVSLTLFETGPDSVAARESLPALLSDFPSGVGGMDQALSQLGIRASLGLLPDLIDPGREMDLAPLTNRDPAAVVQWIYGEREYRLSRFGPALTFYRAALEEDTLLAFAALKAGQAATWEKDWALSREYLERALNHPETLTRRHGHLARGLLFFTDAQPDSAVRWIRAALEEDPAWSEAWMALGEVYHHFFPRGLVVDSSAMACFRRARSLDPGFHPPLIHLAEHAIRVGDLPEAARLIRDLSQGGAAFGTVDRLNMAFACVDREGMEGGWSRRDEDGASLTLLVGRTLAAGGRRSACAEAAFQEILDNPEATRAVRWGASRGLQGLLVAQGRYDEARAILHRALEEGNGEAQYYQILGTLAGAPWRKEAEAIEAYVRGRFGDRFTGLNPQGLWVLGVWLAWKGDPAGTRAVRDALREAVAGGHGTAEPLARAMEGHVLLVEGDTLGAIEQLRTALPRATQVELGWSVSAPLPLRHLRLAELLLATGRPEDALRVAALFDHSEPVVFFPFLRRSLEIRLQAAREADPTRVPGLEERLGKLGAVNGPPPP